MLETPTQIDRSNGEEFEGLCADALRILMVFREGRSFVVEPDDQLRARSKELGQQATVEAE